LKPVSEFELSVQVRYTYPETIEPTNALGAVGMPINVVAWALNDHAESTAAFVAAT
jgi:hypothetical protein